MKGGVKAGETPDGSNAEDCTGALDRGVDGPAIDDVLAEFAALPQAQRDRLMSELTIGQKLELQARWGRWAHAGQIAPGGDWRVWLIRAGRGFGKTRAGAEWINAVARAIPGARIALIGANAKDTRRVMVEGPSGVIAVACEDEAIEWCVTSGEVRWPNGAIAHVYSADTPDALRGPEHHAAWCDELAKWRRGEAAWDNLMMTMRRAGPAGERPRVVVTTTPRPTKLMRRVIALPGTVETRGATRDNPHLPRSFVDAMQAEYGGTRFGRQELDGELIDDLAGALWTRGLLERCRVRGVLRYASSTSSAATQEERSAGDERFEGAEPSPFTRIVVGVDPPAGIGGDACGIVAVGLGQDGFAYVIEDASVVGASPEGWARAVAGCAARVGADRVVAEKNQGGEMVRSTLLAADAGLPVRLVHASRGKVARAEPVAALYERGRAWHVGAFPALEDELCGLIAGGGYEGPGRSPDRADALVWAMTELMLGPRRVGRVRSF